LTIISEFSENDIQKAGRNPNKQLQNLMAYGFKLTFLNGVGLVKTTNNIYDRMSYTSLFATKKLNK
jgi:hypothetical protein